MEKNRVRSHQKARKEISVIKGQEGYLFYQYSMRIQLQKCKSVWYRNKTAHTAFQEEEDREAKTRRNPTHGLVTNYEIS